LLVEPGKIGLEGALSDTEDVRGHCHIEQVEAAPPARSEELTYWNHTLRPSLAGE
jgi:hypothetical protein